jgi:hypothetical protein
MQSRRSPLPPRIGSLQGGSAMHEVKKSGDVMVEGGKV